jgi:regulator of protease activity HflC (stomatin/prohibitin superfamily)
MLIRCAVTKTLPHFAIPLKKPLAPQSAQRFFAAKQNDLCSPDNLKKLDCSRSYRPLFTQVPAGTVVVLERYGKYHRLLGSGPHILGLFDVKRCSFPLYNVCLPIPSQEIRTLDGFKVVAAGLATVRVENPRLAAYRAYAPFSSAIRCAEDAVKTVAQGMTLEKLLHPEGLNDEVAREMNKQTGLFGIRCSEFEIKELTLLAHIKAALANR